MLQNMWKRSFKTNFPECFCDFYFLSTFLSKQFDRIYRKNQFILNRSKITSLKEFIRRNNK